MNISNIPTTCPSLVNLCANEPDKNKQKGKIAGLATGSLLSGLAVRPSFDNLLKCRALNSSASSLKMIPWKSFGKVAFIPLLGCYAGALIGGKIGSMFDM